MSREAQSTRKILFGGGKFRLSMGLTPMTEQEWLAPDAAFAEDLAAKRDLLASRHDAVFRALAEADAAAAELLDLLLLNLPLHHPQHYARQGDGIVNHVTGEAWRLGQQTLHPFDIAGRLVQDDLCLMQNGETGYRLVAASVCSPNRWLIEEKLGTPLAAIHAVVPGYAETLHRPVEHFFAALKPDRIVARVNWGITEDPARFQPVGRPGAAALDPATAGAALWLRIERQTLRRLRDTGAVLFTIRTEIARLDQAVASPADARDLAGMIRDMPLAMQRYKHLAHLAAPLLEWLDRQNEGGSSTPG